MDWLSNIPAAAWAALLTPLIMVLLMSATKAPVRADADGWVRLRPTVGLYVVGILFIPFSVLFTLFPAFAVVTGDTTQSIVLLLLGPPLAALGWYDIYGTFVVRARFNTEAIEYRGLLRRLLVPWAEVRGIKDSVGLGSYISTDRGRLIVWKLLRGFPQLLDEASRHGVEIDPKVRTAG